MQPLLTQAQFQLILSSLLALLEKAATPKEIFSASDRITRLTALHHKLYIQPELQAAKEARKHKVELQPHASQVPSYANQAHTYVTADTELVIIKNEDDERLKDHWFDTLPEFRKPPKIYTVEEVAQLDPNGVHFVNLANLGTIRRGIYDQIREAGMLTEDESALTPLALDFFLGN